MSGVVDQPAPVPGRGASMHDLVVEDLTRWWPASAVESLGPDLEGRKQIGLDRYGTVLQADNGRDALIDAYQEALDLAVYLRQALAEAGWPNGTPTGGLLKAYVSALRTALRVSELVRDRELS